MEMRIGGVVLLTVLFVVAFLAGLFFSTVSSFGVTGNVVKEVGNYSYTRAICSDSKCVDALVTCSDGEVVDVKLASGLVDMPLGWEDSRDNTNLC